MALSFESKRKTPILYLKGRYKRLWPKYIIYLFTYFLLIAMRDGIGKLLNEFGRSYLEICCLQIFGIGSFGINHGAVWYLSVLLVGGYVVYSILYCSKEGFLCFIGLVGSIGSYLYLITFQGGVITHWDSVYGIFRNYCMIRGVAGICTGVLLFYAPKYNFIKKHSGIFHILEILSFVMAYILCFCHEDFTTLSLFMLILNVYLCLSTSHETIVFNNRSIILLSGLSYSIYLNHAIFVDFNILTHLGIRNSLFRVFLYLIFITVYAFFFDILTAYIVDKAKGIRNCFCPHDPSYR